MFMMYYVDYRGRLLSGEALANESGRINSADSRPGRSEAIPWRADMPSIASRWKRLLRTYVICAHALLSHQWLYNVQNNQHDYEERKLLCFLDMCKCEL